MRLVSSAVFGLLSVSTAFPQQIGVVDLTLPVAQVSTQQRGNQLPIGCTQESRGIMANGVRKPDEIGLRRISVEIVKLSSDTLQVGGDGRAEVRLKNVGETPIQIPWSRDSSLMWKAPNSDHLEWEQGSFVVALRDRQNHTIALRSAEWSLFGSQFIAGSQLTIRPGEWITTSLSFKLEDRYHTTSSKEFPVGDARLFAEWEQALRRWNRKNCVWNTAWFDYQGYYKQDRPTAVVQIMKSGSGESKNTE